MTAVPAGAPRVTVGVPVYNGEQYLEGALRALQRQDVAGLEVVVSDNASTDGSLELIRDVVGTDPRFRLLTSTQNRGIARNFNRTLAAASAPFFMWHAVDDLAEPGHLCSCVDALTDDPEAIVAFSRVRWIDGDGRMIELSRDVHDELAADSPSERVARFVRDDLYEAIGYGGVLRTATLRAMGGLGNYYGSDNVLGIQMALRGRWIQVPAVLFQARRHDGQFSKDQGKDVIDQVRTFRPEWRRPVAFPQWYVAARMYGAALAGPGSAAQRAAAAVAVVRLWSAPNWRLLAFDVKRNAVRLARGRYRGVYDGSQDVDRAESPRHETR
ncbi:glycosyltransferase family 2 protein [Luteimicrobium sp. DT211]|uniref:glycosyltransferase family 2 protein n=1 Tax=Luteimicrobium sp. DT211 TaxID=3393412 RepID=UPI003CE68756